MEKQKSVSALKRKLDKIFSQYIRLHWSTDEGQVRCITCGKRGHYKEFHCGHFMSRGNNATRYDERNCNIQCIYCNIYKNGEQWKFGIEIDRLYGKGTADELVKLSNTIKKWKPYELEELIDIYKKRVKILKDKKLS